MSITDHSHITLSDRDDPVLLPWPTQGNAGGFIQFEKAADWRAFVDSLGIDTRIPEIVRAKFARAQTLYLLGWVDFSVVKAGELAALIALELAMMDRYGGCISKSKRSFAALLKYMVDSDGLTDAHIPMVVRCGGSAVGQLTGDPSNPCRASKRVSPWRPVRRTTHGRAARARQGPYQFRLSRYIAEAEFLRSGAGRLFTPRKE